MFKKLILTTATCIALSSVSFFGKAEASTTSEVITIAKQYIGTPYRYGGTTPSGFDCSGYINYVYDKVDVDLPRTTSDLYKVGKSVSKSQLKQGDLVFFQTYKPGASHAGIYISEGKFIHASSSKGITISSVNDPYYWGAKYLGGKRIVQEKPVLPVGDYYDVKAGTEWDTAISALSKRGMIKGYEGSIFKPTNTVTRAQVAEMLANTFKLNKTNKSKIYSDVGSGHWAAGSINAVTKKGFFTGSNGSFRPEEPITREQIAAVISRAFKMNAKGTIKSFKDMDQNDWSYTEVQALAANGITTGYPDQTFKPQNKTTRAQFSVFLYRALY